MRRNGEIAMNRKFTAVISALTIMVMAVPQAFADWKSEYPWAVKGIEYCMGRKILEGTPQGDLMLDANLTRAQMAKILCVAFNISTEEKKPTFTDADPANWAYKYAGAIEEYMPRKLSDKFSGDETVTREEFAATMVRASGLTEGNIRNSTILSENFSDAKDVSPEYKTLLSIAAERAYMTGDSGMIRPKALLTRAEVCTFIQRVAQDKDKLTWEDLGVIKSYTPLAGAAQISAEQAQAWAKSRGAEDIFIDIAPTYWKYGEITGLRPEILYAQAAKETGFGRYTGAVKPEMNNWAGIKIKNPTGDAAEDHETFATPDDGVRAHFNHMSAYVGLAPIGEPHDRYYVVKSIDWAGTVKNLEALGGRWCPDLYYGYSILHGLLTPMLEYGE